MSSGVRILNLKDEDIRQALEYAAANLEDRVEKLAAAR